MSRTAHTPAVLAVHGGCGRWEPREARETLVFIRRALDAGGAVLAAGGPAIDAVCAAVVVLEDAGCFTAGAGALPNKSGVVELDAAVMDGWSGRAGGVAAIRGVRNPVRVARRVMEATPHVLLAGGGATRFARSEGLARGAAVQQPGEIPRGRKTLHDTVGAVARDARGRLAAATSTGGTANKLPGRVGDSPIPGAGLYATRHAAVSTTGRGELMLAALSALRVADVAAAAQRTPAAGMSARLAVGAQQALAALPFTRADAAGLIALGARGDPVAVIRRGRMPFGLLRADSSVLLGVRPR